MTLPGHRFRARVAPTPDGQRYVLTLSAPDARSGGAAEFATQAEALDAIPELLREITAHGKEAANAVV
jgi:hypothetical protein